METFTGAIQTLMKTHEGFHQKLRQRLTVESSNVKNPFNFIAGLFTEGVLCDGSSDTEASVRMKEMMVELAIMLVCSKGADAIGGFTKALEKSGNLHLISAHQIWIKEDFGIETDADLSKPKEKGAGALEAGSSGKLPKMQAKSSTESSSIGLQLIDKIIFHMENEIIVELKDRWIRKASKIVNIPAFCSSLATQNVLNSTGTLCTTRLEGQEELWAKKAIKAACSKKAMGSLVLAFQRSGNEYILEETLEWFETTLASPKSCPIKLRRLATELITAGWNGVKLAFLEQLAPLDNLEEFATFDSQPEPWTERTINLELDKDKLIACVSGFGVTLWNWRANEAKQIELGVRVKEVTCMQTDEEILVMGTGEGSVYLFEARRVKEKCSIVLGNFEPVHSLKFVESTLVVLTRGDSVDKIWWVDISRSDMKLLNKRAVVWSGNSSIVGFFVHPDYTFWYKRRLVYVRTKSGKSISKGCRNCWLDPPDDMSTLSVVDLVSTKGNVVAGCKNGALAIWSLNNLFEECIPLRVIRGHKVPVVSQCAISGHLLSLDQSGKLFMWSGYDLENLIVRPWHTPVPLLVAENLVNVIILVSNGRWFGSSSSKDDTVSSGTLPNVCLRRR